jgi:predicted XRE-type DNA-binding protein
MTTNKDKVKHITPKGRSVFRDLFPEDEAEELEIRSVLLMGLANWVRDCGITQTAAAQKLGVTQARVSDIKNGKINQFSVDMLVKLASRAGLHPRVQLDMTEAV